MYQTPLMLLLLEQNAWAERAHQVRRFVRHQLPAQFLLRVVLSTRSTRHQKLQRNQLHLCMNAKRQSDESAMSHPQIPIHDLRALNDEE